MTPVIFRKDNDGEITAIFPTIPGTSDPTDFLVYAHIGKHGAATANWYFTTQRAYYSEYAPLLRELEQIGYVGLRIYERWQPGFSVARQRARRA